MAIIWAKRPDFFTTRTGTTTGKRRRKVESNGAEKWKISSIASPE